MFLYQVSWKEAGGNFLSAKHKQTHSLKIAMRSYIEHADEGYSCIIFVRNPEYKPDNDQRRWGIALTNDRQWADKLRWPPVKRKLEWV